jgi:hypothetical protein
MFNPNQAFQNQIFRNQAVQNVTFQTIGTCEAALANAARIAAGLFQSLLTTPPVVGECRDFVGQRLDEPGARAVYDELTDVAVILLRLLPTGGELLTLEPTLACEDRLARMQTIVRGLVTLFDNYILPALLLCSIFLLPRTGEAGVQEQLNRVQLFSTRLSTTILAAARQSLPPTF